jgi:hypothetical protein
MNISGNSTCGFEYFKTKKTSKKNIKEALDFAKKFGHMMTAKKLKKLV